MISSILVGMARTRLCLAALIFVLFITTTLSANECIAGKKFKIRTACGTVEDPLGYRIDGATVMLKRDGKGTPFVEKQSRTDGTFDLGAVEAGDYVLVVTKESFPSAWQPLHVMSAKHDHKCSKPIRVVLQVGGCSFVRNAFK